MPRGIALFGMLLLVLAGQLAAVQWDRDEAENALNKARELRGQLADSQSLNRPDYIRCIRLYKRVWLSDPHYGGSDDAIYEAAVLYQEMGTKFSSPDYNQEAGDLFRFLLRDYGLSPHGRDARARLATLEAHTPAEPPRELKTQDTAGQTETPAGAAQASPAEAKSPHAADSTQHKRPAVVRNVRHWTTADCTRVTIDLDGPVRYDSGRVPNPDRLYFDLKGAELNRDLSGKTIAVGDSLLKQIRTGQYRRDVARVVLDFSQTSEVSVSELTNPFRIVIEIRDSGGAQPVASGTTSQPAALGHTANQSPKPSVAGVASAPVPAPRVAGSQGAAQTAPRPPETPPAPARPVDTASTRKSPEVQPTKPAGKGPKQDGKEPASSRNDSVQAEKAKPGLPSGPKPGDRAVIEAPPGVGAEVPPVQASGSRAARASGKADSDSGTAAADAENGEPEPLPGPKPGDTAVIGTSPPATAVLTQADITAGHRALQPPRPANPSPRKGSGSHAKSAATETVGSGDRTRYPATAANVSAASVGKAQAPLDAPASGSLKTDESTTLAARSSEPRVAAANSLPGRDAPPPAKSATPTSRGDMTMTRVLGLKVGRIVIDPGHGGHDTGSVGRNGLMEKDLVLDVARNLKGSLEEKLGAEVLMTRSDDRFISLEERTAFANREKADLFISIHANASRSRSISGVETYYLNFAQTAEDREIAARENATTVLNVGELQDLVRRIAMADKSTESRELAALVQRSLYSGSREIFPRARNRGVRSAPFIVLIGAEMPAVLVEVAFISNPRDERLLKKADSQQVLAQALSTGIEGYLRSLASYVANNHPGSK
jgi:N-acetylmuramoyl-L-alanine amidase